MTVFPNPGSTEVPFPAAFPKDLDFVPALHEGSVVGMATGWAIARGPRDHPVTIVFVTHDIDESAYLGDRIVVVTPSPTEVKEICQVDLPAERDQITTKELPEFARLRAHVYRSIKNESSAEQPA